MNELTLSRLKFKYEELIGVWKDFVTKHTELYELTCKEYSLLLESDIDNLEEVIEQKRVTLEIIAQLDEHRTEILNDFESETMLNKQIGKMNVLVDELKAFSSDFNTEQLERLNLLLIDIINNIQEQNKKNQFFLNRAIHSLNDLQKSFSGKKYDTYSSKGEARANSY
jgi:flagellar biosynthesis/type III secretory pathway chaperone